jgi:hypothetical protein
VPALFGLEYARCLSSPSLPFTAKYALTSRLAQQPQFLPFRPACKKEKKQMKLEPETFRVFHLLCWSPCFFEKGCLMNSVHKHIFRTMPRKWGIILKDPRRCTRRWAFDALLNQVMRGLLSGCRTLRELELFGQLAGTRLPDTTARDLLVQIDPAPLECEIARGVRQASRCHELDDRELPLHLVVVDGKSISVNSHPIDHNSINRSQKGCSKYVNLVLRAFLGSSKVKLLLGQHTVPSHTNERGAFPAFLEKLLALYGRTNLLQVFSLDAGYTSQPNAACIVAAGRYYIMALKNLRGSGITQLSAALLGSRSRPDFLQTEQLNGKLITRKLFRAPAPFKHGWEHAREVWRVLTETRLANGKLTIEQRYFITNIPATRFSHGQVLRAIRLHWSIENNANWVMDTAWQEDDYPWSNKALELISRLRVLAYNVIARLKFRRLRTAARKSLSWKNVFQLVRLVVFPPRPALVSAFC